MDKIDVYNLRKAFVDLKNKYIASDEFRRKDAYVAGIDACIDEAIKVQDNSKISLYDFKNLLKMIPGLSTSKHRNNRDFKKAVSACINEVQKIKNQNREKINQIIKNS